MALVTKQVFLGTFVHSKSRHELEYLHDTAVFVGNDGKIAKVEKDCGSEESVAKHLEQLGWSQDEVTTYACKPGQFFFPGFIDSHVHAPQYPNVGIFGKTTLLEWLAKYTFPLEASLKDLTKARRVYTACVKRTLAHGTTTAAYYATIDVAATNLLADLCLEIGQRALVGRVCMDNPDICPEDYRDESAEESLAKTQATIDHIRSIDTGYALIKPILTPRFAPSCTRKAMLDLADLQRKTDLPVQTHISENTNELALVANLFPDCSSYADVYDKHGLLTPRTILAHAIHLTEPEALLVAERQAKVSHCPCSNSALTSGRARVRWLWDRGVTVGLGTDMSGGYSPSILEAARQAALVSRQVAMRHPGASEPVSEEYDAGERTKLTVDEVLFLATRGGAEVVGLADRIGGFGQGMEWDAQLIGLAEVGEDGLKADDGNVDVFGWEDWEEMLAKWLYNGDDRNTKKVWVKGRLVHVRP